MLKIFTLKDLDIRGKKVLVRVEFNTPLDKKTGRILDDTRLKVSLPTINYLIKNKAKIILICHLGRPKGKVVESLRTAKIAKRLSKILKKKVYYLDDCIGKKVENFVNKMREGDIVLLENLRFYKGEEKNNLKFASALASLADLYINNAFGAAHRSHASVDGITKYLKSGAGFLLEKEITIMGRALEKPKRPFIAIIGGLSF